MAEGGHPQLYDAQSGHPVDMPHEQIPDALTSGRVAYMKGATIPVISPDGTPGTIPAEQAHEAFSSGYKYDTPEQQSFRAGEEKFGGSPVSAGAAGAARMLTLGLSDVGMTQSGLVDPETLQGLKEHNPVASVAGEVVGAAAPLVLTGGASAPAQTAAAGAAKFTAPVLAAKVGDAAAIGIEKLMGKEAAKTLAQRIIAKAVPKAAGSAVEGAIYGVGQTVSEAALGDPSLNAEKAISNVGWSTVIGGGIGTVLGVGAGFLSKSATEGAETATKAAMSDDLWAQTLKAVETPEAAPGAPTSIADMEAKIKNQSYQGQGGDHPTKRVAINAVQNLPDLQMKPFPLQIESLADQGARDRLSAFVESDSKEAELTRQYMRLQKSEAVAKTAQTVNRIGGDEYIATAEAARNGEKAIKAFTDQYEAEQKLLAPKFKEFDRLGANSLSDPQELISRVQEAIPGTSKYLTATEDGFKIAKYDSSMPFSKNVYEGVKDVVEQANKKDLTIGELRNIRKNLRSRIDFSSGSAGADGAEISRLGKSLMDHIEEQVGRFSSDPEVRETFKRYAINEQSRETMEKIIGGSLSDRASLLKAVKPEQVVDRIFSNTNSVKAAREILGDGFNKVLSDHMAEQIHNFTDKGVLSSQRLATYLKSNADVLNEAFAHNPEGLTRLRALADYMRILPDMPSSNPSGSAKQVTRMFGAVSKLGSLLSKPFEIPGKLLEHAGEYVERQHAIGEFEHSLSAGGTQSPRVAAYVGLKRLETMSSKVTDKIQQSIKGFAAAPEKSAIKKVSLPASISILHEINFSGAKGLRAPANRKDAFSKRSEEIADLSANPAALMDRISKSLQGVSSAAPQIGAAMSETAARGVQFLFDKAPKNPSNGASLNPLLRKWHPSETEISKWERYVSAVENPMSVLEDLKHGRVSHEGVEAIKTVYPKIYGEVVSQITQHVSEMRQELPYKKRLQLSVLFGVPVDAAMDPGFISYIQDMHAQAPAAGPPQGSAPSVSPRASQAMMTDTQKIATRKDA